MTFETLYKIIETTCLNEGGSSEKTRFIEGAKYANEITMKEALEFLDARRGQTIDDDMLKELAHLLCL